MKKFKKGLLFGLGVVAILSIFIPVSAFASQLSFPVNFDIGEYQQTPLGYEFVWIQQDETCKDMSTRLGIVVNQIQRGDITIGYETQVIEGKSVQVPITRKGIKIIFNTLPATTITDRLDYQIGIDGFQRTGGKSIVDTLQKADTIEVIP